MLQQVEYRGLGEEITRLGGPTSKETILHIDLAGRDPDDGLTQIPYDKGAAFVRLLEKTVGREVFDVFLRGYFEHHAFKSITTAQFVAYLREHLLKGDAELEQRIKVQEWLYQPGMPDNAPVPTSDVLARVEQQAKSFELRAATGLATLLQGSGRVDEARAVLAPVYEWFDEGHDTADLVSARTTLSGTG